MTMVRASTLSIHERRQNVVKCSRKAIINFLRHQEEYGAKKSSGRPGNLNDLEKREILRTTSSSTISINEIRRTCDIDASKTTMKFRRSTKTWLEDSDVEILGWYSCSSDLNPMENLWTILVYWIYADSRQFETAKDLQFAICKA
uniref:HTH_Tnp_Tc3_2 domain-containing protein n=1 Tax=Heterorhabditis bacteriophora TaxID=37862 RepID=A0A1I7XAB4_HETBA